jgi:hypothetical protein
MPNSEREMGKLGHYPFGEKKIEGRAGLQSF